MISATQSGVTRTLSIVLAAIAFSCSADFSIESWAPSPGGGASSGGGYSLTGSFDGWGHLQATNETLVLEAGSWILGGFRIQPALRAILDRDHLVVFWSKELGDGWTLEVADSAAERASWSPISRPYSATADTYFVSVPATGLARFYRLRETR